MNKKLEKSTGGYGGMGTFSYLPMIRYPRAIVGSYGVFVHYFEILDHPLPNSVKLRLGKVCSVPRNGQFNGVDERETLTNTIVTFYLDE